MGKELLERLQDRHCDWSRGTKKGFRVLRNVGDAARHFPLSEPLMCFGCGDGLEVEAFKLLGFDVIGCDISRKKRLVAEQHNTLVYAPDDPLLEQIERNIYCAHTIEHVEDLVQTLEYFEEVAISTICIICPIEPRGSRNPSHLSPIRSIRDLELSDWTYWKPIRIEERFNDEPEAVLVWKYK